MSYGFAFLFSMFLAAWGGFQLWRAYKLGRIMFGPSPGDVQRASEPCTFWVSVVVHVLIAAVGVAWCAVLVIAPVLRNSN